MRETRAESLRALEANIDRGRFVAANGRSGSGAGATAGAAAAGALRAAAEVAPRAAAAARPMLEVISGGLDRLPAGTAAAARGRVLILIAGLLAAGLIYISVGKLQAGDGYARYAERTLQLQRENTIRRAQIAHRGSSERIVALAKKQGMTMPYPEQFSYVRGRRNDPLKAIRTFTTPVATPPSVAPAEVVTPAPIAPPAQTVPPAQAPATTPTPAPGAAVPPISSPGAAGTGGQ